MNATATEEDEYLLIIMQHLRERQHMESLHMLQRESGVYFDMAYIESLLQRGMFNEITTYFKGFISYGDDALSMKTFYEITKQKFLETLYAKGHLAATAILVDELLQFNILYHDDIHHLAYLLTGEDFGIKKYQEAQGVWLPHSGREKTKEEEPNSFAIENSRAGLSKLLNDCIRTHPSIRGKCYLPPLESSRLKVDLQTKVMIILDFCMYCRSLIFNILLSWEAGSGTQEITVEQQVLEVGS